MVRGRKKGAKMAEQESAPRQSAWHERCELVFRLAGDEAYLRRAAESMRLTNDGLRGAMIVKANAIAAEVKILATSLVPCTGCGAAVMTACSPCEVRVKRAKSRGLLPDVSAVIMERHEAEIYMRRVRNRR